MFYSKGSKAKGTSFNSLPSQVMGWHQSVQRFMSHTISYLSTKEKWSTKENTALFFVCIIMAKFLILASLIHALPSTTICSISTPIKTSRIHTMFSYFAQFMARLCAQIGFRSNETWLLSGDSISPPIIRPKVIQSSFGSVAQEHTRLY